LLETGIPSFMPLMATTVRDLAAALVAAAIIVAALVLGRPILIPLAAAVIVAFMLSPVVRWLARIGLNRALSVVGVLGVTSALLISLAVVLSAEMLSLTARIDTYKENIVAKVRMVTSLGRGDSTVKRAIDALERLGDDVSRELARDTLPRPTAPEPAPNDSKAASPHETTAPLSAIDTVAVPAAYAGLTFLFSVFLMFQHQDLRDRLIRILGTRNLSGTTNALSDAGSRLSRLFLGLAVLNAVYGIVVGCVLWLLGVPGALVWGALAALMRFVPLVGSFIAAAPPIFLAAGVVPGWEVVLFTALFFLVAEIGIGSILEPLVLGNRVGLSPFAMIAAASFWTLVWGPVGLILAAPLTTVMVVMGRYISGLSFLRVLLGDEPALEAQQVFYQRLLSADPLAAADRLESWRADNGEGLPAATDRMVLPALRLAAIDAGSGGLTARDIETIRATLDEAVQLAIEEPQTGAGCGRIEAESSVLVVGARGAVDIAAARFLAAMVASRCGRPATAVDTTAGLTALSGAALGDRKDAPPVAVVLASVSDLMPRQLALITRRAASAFPDSRILVRRIGRPELDTNFVREEISGHATIMSSTGDLLAALNCKPLLEDTASRGHRHAISGHTADV
jgi:predicted PurR-regulated permease PerM